MTDPRPPRRAPAKTKVRQAQEFAVVLAVLLSAIGGYLYYGGAATAPMVLGGVAVLVLVLAFVVTGAWMALFALWMKLAEGLGWVMTRVILSVFYFTILTPVGLAMRVAGKRPLDVAWKDGKSSYWIEKESSERTTERYSKMF